MHATKYVDIQKPRTYEECMTAENEEGTGYLCMNFWSLQYFVEKK